MITPRLRGSILFIAGAALLFIGLSLSLYSVPVNGDQFHLFPFILTSDTQVNGFILLRSPLVPLLHLGAAALLAAGWVLWRRSISPLLLVSIVLIAFGFLIGLLVSITTDFRFFIVGMTFHVSPFWSFFEEPLLLGFSIAAFSVLFRLASQLLQKQSRGLRAG